MLFFFYIKLYRPSWVSLIFICFVFRFVKSLSCFDFYNRVISGWRRGTRNKENWRRPRRIISHAIFSNVTGSNIYRRYILHDFHVKSRRKILPFHNLQYNIIIQKMTTGSIPKVIHIMIFPIISFFFFFSSHCLFFILNF